MIIWIRLVRLATTGADRSDIGDEWGRKWRTTESMAGIGSMVMQSHWCLGDDTIMVLVHPRQVAVEAYDF